MHRIAESGHLSENDLALLKSGALSAEDRCKALSHTAICGMCALRLAEMYEEDEDALIGPPASFLEDTLGRLGIETDAGVSKKQYYLYCLRVGLAVCASIMLVFSGTFDRIPEGFRSLPPASQGQAYTQRLADGMRAFTDNLIHLEVFKNEK
jgi:hypothetical protein